jgi:fibronectin type 3 domain-containing protein
MPSLAVFGTARSVSAAARIVCTGALLFSAATTNAAELTVGEGVVIKFGADASLVVRDRITVQRDAALTSERDSAVGGTVRASLTAPTPGSWRGVRLEKSSSSYGVSLTDALFRHAGADGTSALTIRGFSPSLSFLRITDSTIGLRAVDGGSPTLNGLLVQRNGIGIEVDGNAAPQITQGTISQNTNGIVNRTPATIVQATNTWWGHASGPKDAVANPQGQGDTVSSGVNYASPLAFAPLVNPNVRLADAPPFFEQATVRLLLACTNATEYRIAEGGAFAGVPFAPMTEGRATADFELSAGDGTKSISVQYRDAAGNVATATLAGGVLVDTQVPAVALTTPAPDSVVTGQISVAATASDGSGIANVRFYLDGALQAADTSAPYGYTWNTESTPEGMHVLRVVATDVAGRTAEETRTVTVAREVLPPDNEGPTVTNIRLNSVALADGATIAQNGTITLSVSDRSGISRVELLIDGAVAANATGTTTFTVPLNIDNVDNGPHALALRAVDSLNNTTLASFNITVAHAPPAVPAITQPANGLVTRAGTVVVSGTAAAGTQVQLVVNDTAVGAPIDVGGSGTFTASVTLSAGQNRIQARASDRWGASALSGVILVTLDTTVPLPPSNLTALAQSAGVIKLAWNRSSDASVVGYDVYRAASSFATLGEAVRVNASRLTGATFDDMPKPDGAYFYRVVAVNGAGTPSDPTNLVQVNADSTLPRATSITYQALGQVDPTTGAIGQGRVDVTLTVNEALQTAPYLALTFEGAAPITIDLTRQTDTRYAGSFTVDANTPTGAATAIFSARDLVGNRGTDIDAGRTVAIDAEGPTLTGIALSPGAPLRADGAPVITATLTFSEALKSGTAPDASYLLSGPVRVATPLTGLSAVNATTWRGTFTLPADAGVGSPEYLSFGVRAVDALDNVSTKIVAANRFQVYQGDLPPGEVPAGLIAKAQPAGKVRLTWTAVAEAAAYQIYRQAPGETELTALIRATSAEFIDTTPQDGAYRYTVASVRQANSQETLSAQSAPVDVTTSSQAPGAPQNLALDLIGQGIRAQWQAPAGGNVATYNVYRATTTQINSIEGLTPLRTGITGTLFVDTNPTTTGHSYVVTALDFAGNESAISNSAYLNASLFPVRSLRVEQLGNALPVVTWTAPSSSVAGYNVYVGADDARVKLTPAPIAALSFTDTGFVSGERRYTVAAVDSNGVEMARSLLLPNVAAQIVSGLPLKRGVMNRVQVQVANGSAAAIDNARVIVRAGAVDHKSEPISLAPNETRLVPVVVGGYHDLPNPTTLAVGIEATPNEGEAVKVTRNASADVLEGALAVGFSTEDFTRGGVGKVRLTIENTTDVDIELLTARGNGASPSDELRFKLLDADSNVLATQSYLQATGAGVVTLTNGLTVARIAAGARFTSDAFDLRVPAASPDRIRVQLEVDRLRHRTGEPEEIAIRGRGSETQVALVDTAYYGEVTNAAPAVSFGDVDVVITGRAVDRTSQQPLPNSRLKLILNQEGFERTVSVTTNAAGEFAYALTPGPSDVHPDITDRPEQRSFVINRVRVTPSWKVSVPPNYPYTIPLQLAAGPGTSANNVRLVLNPLSQPTGQIPEGLSLGLPSPINIGPRQTLSLPVQFNADSRAAAKGAAILDLLADGTGSQPIGQVRIDYVLTEAKPFLVATPNVVNTGMAQGGIEVESVTLENKGILPLADLQLSLTMPDGTPAPSWVSLATASNVGTLALGDKRNVEINFAPPAATAEGVYQFRLRVEGSNYPADSVPIFASVTQSGIGNALFKASDIYTATVNRDGQLIQGLANASIEVQNEDVPTITQTRLTDSYGEAFFEGLPAGRYKFRARASNHQELGGRFQIKPGVTLTQPIFLEYNLVTVEWTVREITIEDRYEIILNATFETDVPAAVVVMEPASVNLPAMKPGEVFQGELTLTNYGLIRADNVKQQLPTSDQFFKFEFLVAPPESLEAKQRVRIPYRVTALTSLEQSGDATGGGCFTYTNVAVTSYEWVCANGTLARGKAQTTWARIATSTCPATPGIPGLPGGGGGSGGAGGGPLGGTGGGYTELQGLPPCVKCSVVCDRCNAPGMGGGGSGGAR